MTTFFIVMRKQGTSLYRHREAGIACRGDPVEELLAERGQDIRVAVVGLQP